MVEMPVAVASSVLSPSIKEVLTTVMPSPLRKSRNCCAASAEARCASLVESAESGSIDQAAGTVRAHLRAQLAELVFDVGSARARRVHLEQARLQVRSEIECPTDLQIAHDLVRAFVEAHVQRALAALAGGGREETGERRLGGAGRARDEDVAAAVIPAAQHVVETRQARSEIRSSVTSYFSSVGPRLVSCMPSAVSEIGNSSPAKPEPRYFMTRRLRNADPSTT